MQRRYAVLLPASKPVPLMTTGTPPRLLSPPRNTATRLARKQPLAAHRRASAFADKGDPSCTPDLYPCIGQSSVLSTSAQRKTGSVKACIDAGACFETRSANAPQHEGEPLRIKKYPHP